MVYKLRMIFTDGIYDFSTYEWGRNIPFKIFDEADLAYDLSGYTREIKILNDTLDVVLNGITPTVSVPSSGTGTFKFTSTQKITADGYYFAELAILKSPPNDELSAISPRLYFRKRSAF